MTIGDNIVNWDKVTLQKQAFQELEKFVPGESGLNYYPVPIEEWQEWKKEQDKKAMEEWESKEKEKKEALLNLREEKPRGNGHNNNKKILEELKEKNPDIEVIERYQSNEFCDLKKQNKKRRGRPKKNVL